MKNTVIWLDGALVPQKEASIPLTTHTLHYGSGAFEGIRCYATDNGPAVFRLSDHVERLLQSFSCFGAPFPWSKEAIEQAIIATIKANAFEDCYIRPIIFFGGESLLLSPKELSIHCAILVMDMDKYLGKEPIRMGISSVKRIHPESMPIHHKINGFYVNSILAFHDARSRGFDEALLLDHGGTIAEGSVANIFFVVDGVLITPSTTSILPGITRSTILSIAKELGIETRVETLPLEIIEKATEAFLCGTASEITPIKSIESKYFSAPGGMTQALHTEYQSAIRGKRKEPALMSRSWVTFVNGEGNL